VLPRKKGITYFGCLSVQGSCNSIFNEEYGFDHKYEISDRTPFIIMHIGILKIEILGILHHQHEIPER
jgi:hypothetical protein